MSATRDPDRIFRAWLEQMPSEAPDRAIDAVLQATAAAPQVRAWPLVGRWRPNQMNRLSLIAATAVVALALIGGAILLTSGSPGPAQPTATPATSTATPAASAAAATTPQSLRSTWVANAPTGSAGAFLKLSIDDSLITVLDAGSESVLARAATATGGEVAFVAPDSNHGCQSGDVGRYSFAFARPTGDPTAGDLQLDLTASEDACAARKAILERTWTRAFTSGFTGGRAVAIDFDPMFMVTLPQGTYDVTVGGRDALMVESPTDGGAPGMLVATRNPAGYSDPCSETGGSKVPLAHTVDAVATYFDSLPGFSVQRTNVTIGGRPAVHLTVPTEVTADCPGADHRVIEWSTSDPTFPVHWIIGQGSYDSIYLVEVGEDLYLFQWLNAAADPVAEMAVLSTLTFIDAIPG